MATTTEIRNFALENNCSDAIALKVLTLRAENARLREALESAARRAEQGPRGFLLKRHLIELCRGLAADARDALAERD